MNRILVATALATVWAGAANADAPAYLPVQGILANTDGTGVDGDTSIRFALYTADVGGTELWFETQTVLVEDGFFTAYLGDVTLLDLATFRNNGNVWLGVKVESDLEMQRIQIATTGFAAFAQYAGTAANATTLDGHDVSYFATSGGAVDWTAITNVPADLQDGDADTLGAVGVCADGQIIEWSGGAWVCAGNDAGGGDLTAVTAGAGIEILSGTGPIPTVGVADDGIDSAMIVAGAVGSEEIADGAVAFADWAGNGCGASQIPRWSGSAWGCADDSLGPVYAAGDGILQSGTDPVTFALDWATIDLRYDTTPDTIADDGTISLGTETTGTYDDTPDTIADDGFISGAEIADGTIAAADIAAGAVQRSHLAACGDGQILKYSLVGGWACVDDDGGLGDITDVVAGNGLTGGGSAGLVTLSVGAGAGINVAADMVSIASGGVSSTMIADGAVALADVNTGSLDTRYSVTTHTHNFDATYVNEGQANSISSAMIADAAVTSADILDGTILSGDIADGTVTAADLGASSVSSQELTGTSGQIDIHWGLNGAHGSMTGADIPVASGRAAAGIWIEQYGFGESSGLYFDDNIMAFFVPDSGYYWYDEDGFAGGADPNPLMNLNAVGNLSVSGTFNRDAGIDYAAEAVWVTAASWTTRASFAITVDVAGYLACEYHGGVLLESNEWYQAHWTLNGGPQDNESYSRIIGASMNVQVGASWAFPVSAGAHTIALQDASNAADSVVMNAAYCIFVPRRF